MSKAFKVRHPLCVYCLQIGKTTSVHGRLGVVDHIKPHNGDLKLFWDESNWQSLCNACHDSVKRDEFDIKFLVRKMGFDIDYKIVKKYISAGEMAEIIKIISNMKQ